MKRQWRVYFRFYDPQLGMEISTHQDVWSMAGTKNGFWLDEHFQYMKHPDKGKYWIPPHMIYGFERLEYDDETLS